LLCVCFQVESMEQGLRVMTGAEEDSVKLKTAVTELQLTADEKKREFDALENLMRKEEARVDKEEAKVADFKGYLAKILEDVENQRDVIVKDLNQVRRGRGGRDPGEVVAPLCLAEVTF